MTKQNPATPRPVEFDHDRGLTYQPPEPEGDYDAQADDQFEDLAEDIHQAYLRLVDAAPMNVKISGRDATLTVHPAALLFRAISAEEFDALVLDVLDHGFKQPVTITEDGQVLDGRHRAAVSMATGISLNSPKVFKGSDAEARAFVISANLQRRHLSTVERALLARTELMPALKEAAEDRMRRGVADPSATLHKGRASAVAAKILGEVVSARSIDAMAIVDDAPETQARIRSGEIETIAEAVKAAEAELGQSGRSPQRRTTKQGKSQSAMPKGSRREPEVIIGDLEVNVAALVARYDTKGLPTQKRQRTAQAKRLVAAGQAIAELVDQLS